MENLLQEFNAAWQVSPWKGKKILVAVSGGVDSMVLSYLLLQTGSKIALAHCNYQLRAAASTGDEVLLRDWAAAQGLKLHVRHIDTKKLLEEVGGNLQATARTLRYDWFKQLSEQEGYDYIATAHHAQDAIETMLYNLFTGTGIAGMHGILPQQDKVIRPLLPYWKQDITTFALGNNIPWREDSSNAKTDYARNKIRHEVLPRIEAAFPNALRQMSQSMKHFREAECLYEQALAVHRKKLLTYRKEDVYIAVRKIKQVSPLPTIMWALLQDFGFTHHQLPDLLRLLQAESGKYVVSPSHRALRNREHLIITRLPETERSFFLLEQQQLPINIQTPAFSLQLKEMVWGDKQAIPILPPGEAVISAVGLEYPLLLRPWSTGDYFYPLGLNKKKKVSRFLIDQKVPLHEKEQVWVLESNKTIVWVIGHRIDHRYRVLPDTGKVLRLSWRSKK